MTTQKKMTLLKSGRLVTVQRKWPASRSYWPTPSSIGRAIRLYLKGSHDKKRSGREGSFYYVTCTTGGMVDPGKTTNTTCMCQWHRDNFPERFGAETNAFGYPEPPPNYVAE